MKFFKLHFFQLFLLFTLIFALNLKPAEAQFTPVNYNLLTNASATGRVVTITGGCYLLSANGTFGGSSLTIVETYNGASSTLTIGPFTSSFVNFPLIVGHTYNIQAVLTGGSPSGIYAELAGAGNGICAALGHASVFPEVGNNGSSNPIVNAYGSMYIESENTIPSYVSSFAVTPSNVGVFAQICGSSSKIIRVKGFEIQGDATAAGTVTIAVTKTSSASTGATSVTPTPFDDVTDSADAASVGYFSSPPTAGTTVGKVFQEYYSVPLAASVVNPIQKSFSATPYDQQALVLRSASECLQFSTAGALPTGANFFEQIYDTDE